MCGTALLNSFAPIRLVPALEFGTIAATVKGESYDPDGDPVTVTLNEQVPLAVNWFGGTANQYCPVATITKL